MSRILRHAPVPAGDRAQQLFEIVVDRHTFERRGGQLAQDRSVGFTIGANDDGHDSGS